MGVLGKIKDFILSLLPTGEYDPWEGSFVLYESDACNFEVLDKGMWYRIDAEHLESDLYEDEPVPESVLARAREVLDPFWRSPQCHWGIDPTPYYQDLLSKEFDNVRFINMTFKPGAVY